ncbi:hypothetical protein Pcinc_007502 [Petrolisthes cinctipes]|uniref:Uncharacterized protein n=1 Tax=Petrolisthes cinctipes TaxID=88211 RepID=A0AAE1GAZ0_PETCI|nr:hypothetical protein Pcinc_007502 [Petrolisthes cinctipes]
MGVYVLVLVSLLFNYVCVCVTESVEKFPADGITPSLEGRQGLLDTFLGPNGVPAVPLYQPNDFLQQQQYISPLQQLLLLLPTQQALGPRQGIPLQLLLGGGPGLQLQGGGPGLHLQGLGQQGGGPGLQLQGSGPGLQLQGSGPGLPLQGGGPGLQLQGVGPGLQLQGGGPGLPLQGSGPGFPLQGLGQQGLPLLQLNNLGSRGGLLTSPLAGLGLGQALPNQSLLGSNLFNIQPNIRRLGGLGGNLRSLGGLGGNIGGLGGNIGSLGGNIGALGGLGGNIGRLGGLASNVDGLEGLRGNIGELGGTLGGLGSIGGELKGVRGTEFGAFGGLEGNLGLGNLGGHLGDLGGTGGRLESLRDLEDFRHQNGAINFPPGAEPLEVNQQHSIQPEESQDSLQELLQLVHLLSDEEENIQQQVPALYTTEDSSSRIPNLEELLNTLRLQPTSTSHFPFAKRTSYIPSSSLNVHKNLLLPSRSFGRGHGGSSTSPLARGSLY